MVKLLVLFHYVSSLVWLCSGILIIASPYLTSQYSLWRINLVVGIPFVMAALYFHYKRQLLIQYLTKTTQEQEKQLKRKLIITELIAFILAFSVGTLCLSMVIYRIFLENVPVFG